MLLLILHNSQSFQKLPLHQTDLFTQTPFQLLRKVLSHSAVIVMTTSYLCPPQFIARYGHSPILKVAARGFGWWRRKCHNVNMFCKKYKLVLTMWTSYTSTRRCWQWTSHTRSTSWRWQCEQYNRYWADTLKQCIFSLPYVHNNFAVSYNMYNGTHTLSQCNGT